MAAFHAASFFFRSYSFTEVAILHGGAWHSAKPMRSMPRFRERDGVLRQELSCLAIVCDDQHPRHPYSLVRLGFVLARTRSSKTFSPQAFSIVGIQSAPRQRSTGRAKPKAPNRARPNPQFLSTPAVASPSVPNKKDGVFDSALGRRGQI